MKSRGKIWVVATVGLVVIIGVLVGIKVGQIRGMINAGKSFVPPPESVTSAKVASASWQGKRSAIGSVVAVHDVTLGAELPGLIREVTFDSGKNVKRGMVLVKLDTTNEEAQLSSAVADAALADASLERAVTLRKGGANTPADLDAAQSRQKQAHAAVANLRASITKKTIRAPFDGRIAIRQVERGQVVSPGTPIATLQSVDPILAEFSLPQQALATLKLGQAVTLRVDSFPEREWQGVVSTVNSEVDATTRNIKVRAAFANKDGVLRPGMFVNVDIMSADKQNVLLIPSTAVVYAPYGDSVFVLESSQQETKRDGKSLLVAQPRFVRLGERRGDLVEVISGLKDGETVVANGAFKLRKGVAVMVNNALAPTVELNPKPTDR